MVASFAVLKNTSILQPFQVYAEGGLLAHPGRQAGLRRGLPELRGLVSHGHQVWIPINPY